MIFNIQLRNVTGIQIEMEDSKNRSSIAYLMHEDIALNHRQQSFGSYAAQSVEASPLARPNTPGEAVNMSERRMLNGQNSEMLVDDESGSYLPSIQLIGRGRGNVEDYDFRDDESQATDEGEGNDRVEEIYRQQMEAAKAASMAQAQMQNQRTRLASSGARRSNKSRGRRRRESRDMEDDDGGNDNAGRVGRDGMLVKPMLM